jgi:L-ascorbate metabolism protein UlaG (beta-lactamase superfamily)
MEIKFFGHLCFRIKGKDVVLITNPLDPSLGIKLPPLAADVLVSSDKKNQVKLDLIDKAVNRQEPFIINSPGEYEVGGSFILGIQTEKNILYVMTIDGLRLAFLSGLNRILSEKQLEELDGVDILFLAVGEKAGLSPKLAMEIINQIEPKIIIPMAYKIPQLKLDLVSIEEFLKQMGIEQANTQEKLIISKDKLPLEKEVVVLNARS